MIPDGNMDLHNHQTLPWSEFVEDKEPLPKNKKFESAPTQNDPNSIVKT